MKSALDSISNKCKKVSQVSFQDSVLKIVKAIRSIHISMLFQHKGHEISGNRCFNCYIIFELSIHARDRITRIKSSFLQCSYKNALADNSERDENL